MRRNRAVGAITKPEKLHRVKEEYSWLRPSRMSNRLKIIFNRPSKSSSRAIGQIVGPAGAR